MCEEFEFHQDRSGQPDVLMGQSIILSEIKAEVPLETDILRGYQGSGDVYVNSLLLREPRG